jgi:hypothetical protein
MAHGRRAQTITRDPCGHARRRAGISGVWRRYRAWLTPPRWAPRPRIAPRPVVAGTLRHAVHGDFWRKRRRPMWPATCFSARMACRRELTHLVAMALALAGFVACGASARLDVNPQGLVADANGPDTSTFDAVATEGSDDSANADAVDSGNAGYFSDGGDAASACSSPYSGLPLPPDCSPPCAAGQVCHVPGHGGLDSGLLADVAPTPAPTPYCAPLPADCASRPTCECLLSSVCFVGRVGGLYGVCGCGASDFILQCNNS